MTDSTSNTPAAPCDASSCDADCTCGNNLTAILMAMSQARAGMKTTSAGLNAAIDAMEKPDENNLTRTAIAPSVRNARILEQAVESVKEEFHNRSNSFIGVASLTQTEVDFVLAEFRCVFPGAVFIAYCEPNATPDDNGCTAFTLVGKW